MNKKENQELKRRMKAWVFDHANEMIEELNMERSAAFRQAHLVRELLEKLGQGKVCFQYRKQDESEREAFGTLRAGIDPVFDAYVYKNDVKTNQHAESLNFTYWDLKKKGFRTFSAARIVKIIAVAIPNYREHENHELIEFV
jgi:hypothetical protein